MKYFSVRIIFHYALGLFSVTALQSAAQSSSDHEKFARPKLVVGIVVDQMRYDLLWRFWDQYSGGGFKRLVKEGFLCENARFNYFLTVTAVGHSTIYAGTEPSIHGVVDNFFFDRTSQQAVYVMTDSTVKTVGNINATTGMSPFRLMSTTVTDELKLVSTTSKVIGIAEKDRSAMLPAGHFADGAYYFDAATGNWISSTWYMNQLPEWLQQFNQSKKINEYVSTDWKLLLPRSAYSMCTNDTTPFEHPLKGEVLPVFPHKLGKDSYGNLPFTPFGNTMTKDVAVEAIKNEKLGKRNVTDFLCISFSSTDLIGHWFGPNSLEVADCYLRLDRDLEVFLKLLGETLGKENVLVFLTADHGGAINPGFGKSHKLSGGVMLSDSLLDEANQYVSSFFGKGNWISSIMPQQVYLNKPAIGLTKFSYEEVAKKAADFMMLQPGILCITSPAYNLNTCSPTVQSGILNGYYPERSGDLFYSMKPGWIDWIFEEGTSHGTVFAYDQHVPLIWYGWHIQPGASAEKADMADVAPTISNWLRIAFPSGCTGNPLSFIPLK
ncbi:MAG: alkaline phosphatase family protein [Chitinophagales bacterium]